MSQLLPRWRRLCAVLALLSAAACPAPAQTLLQASGPQIVNASGQPVVLKGMNLGGWMLQEGYMLKPGYGGTQGNVKRLLHYAGQNDAQIEAFYQSWRDNFVTKADVDFLAAKGFNCLRLPLHYELFLTPAQRAVRTGVSTNTVTYGAYVDSLTSWYAKNQLFTDPGTSEGFRLVNETLSWAGGNGMYVVLDLHAAPGAQGTDTNIADALQPNGFWNNAINQDVANRLWQTIATRYQGDPRVAMYDVLNEPNNVPGAAGLNGNQRIHDVLQRFINTIRATGDQHLILLEGNGFGNDYNWMEKRTFTNAANLVYSSHRYSGATYPLDNNVSSTDPGNPNSLRTIGNLTQFRTDNNVPIWVGETGENTATWMADAARSLSSVGIGYCHWTLKRFENGPNAALFHIPPPYLVDGPQNIPAVLQHIQHASNVLHSDVLSAVAPTPGGTVRPAVAPVGRLITLRSVSTGNYLSGESGQQPMTTTHPTAGASEQFAVLDAGQGKVYLRSLGKYVSSENGQQPMTCTRPTAGQWEAFDWFVNADSTISLGGYNGRYVASGASVYPVSCAQTTLSSFTAFTLKLVGTALAAKPAAASTLAAYPNPVADRLTYALPAGMQAHAVEVVDATGRVVLRRSYGSVGSSNALDMSDVVPGLYVVRVAGEGLAQAWRVVKE